MKIIEFLKRSIIFTIIIIVLGISFNFISPGGLPLIIKKRTIIIGDKSYSIPLFTTKNNKIVKKKNFYSITKIDIKSALQMFHNSEPIFIDARSKKEYEIGHIPGAINIPMETIDLFELDLFNFDNNQKFVCYCSDEKCDLSMEIAMAMEEKGFTNIYYFSEGWIMWLSKGYQVSTGTKP